ncbi:MAG: hypothetical protein LBH74_07615 [Nitrososphaerota archaeon]|jgi:hypothetical protein|uniref:hypothetical protein n=1 Tax=Candidatus Bathycorpusculum sp. TaxID=2994959 RepID=UPI0028364037|nr:hypothetical protein [Candidatus Termitimicrobium sp.]MCL2431544.1 hypothetical protein [Candidatus Termitimicrobium sp.]MDR0493485.1 hypothetical protein [Nitrososphaerota archaeon]
MKRTVLLAVSAILLVVIVSATILIVRSPSADKPFYVGITYGGDTVEGAKLLIDKVKDYTNLFILSSGSLQHNLTHVEEIGDYAIASGLNFAPSYGAYFENKVPPGWVNDAQQRWGNHFVGIYFYDEPGGKMLDDNVEFLSYSNSTLHKSSTGIIHISELGIERGGIEWITYTTSYYPNGTAKVLAHSPDKTKPGNLLVFYPDDSSEVIPNVPWTEENRIEYPNGTTVVFSPESIQIAVTYHPDGAIIVLESYDYFDTVVDDSARLLPVEPFSDVLDRKPLKTFDEATQAFETETAWRLQPLENSPVPLFTSDYALYWWDYQSGYDFVLAQLGWNNSVTQEIGLVRGAANLQNKQWGTILTWKYTQAPYLPDGAELFEQMKTSYEAGADYVIVFNYSEDATRSNILQDEHFQALERFWNDVVQNSNIVHGGLKAEAVLILPQNYGWGMRNPNDSIWGIWPANNTEIWNQIQARIDQYGTKLDIVFEDPNCHVTGKYLHTYYWNQP